MTKSPRCFYDRLKTPGYLSQIDVARIRNLAQTAAAQDFEERFGVSAERALLILNFWEAAQIATWDAELLQRFFFPMIYADRELVSARITAAQTAGRLPERFSPEIGLEWLESENVLTGMMPWWVRANIRSAAGKTHPNDVRTGTPRKLTDEQRQEVVQRHNGGQSESAIARHFNVSRRTVGDVLIRAGVKEGAPRRNKNGARVTRTYRAGTRAE